MKMYSVLQRIEKSLFTQLCNGSHFKYVLFTQTLEILLQDDTGIQDTNP